MIKDNAYQQMRTNPNLPPSEIEDAIKQLRNLPAIIQYVTNEYLKSDMFKLIYPVGSIYISVAATDPGTLFGGTWVAFGTGRTLVSRNSADTWFDTVEETGGAKEVTLTEAQIPNHEHNDVNPGKMLTYVGSGGTDGWFPAGTAANLVTNSTAGGGQPHTNMPPYIVVYMWKRTE